jgi:hypothetical protein
MPFADDSDGIRIEFDADPDDRRREPEWGFALAMLAMAAGFAFLGEEPASIGAWMLRIFAVAFFISLFFIAVLQPAPDPDLALAHNDFFGRIEPAALARKRGYLAVVARVLEENRAALKRDFTVVTAAGRRRDRFPWARDPLAPWYVALACNREPVALFFYWSLSPSILAHEFQYRLQPMSVDDEKLYYYPELRITGRDGRSKRLGLLAYYVGERARRALGLEHGPKRVRTRLWLPQVTPVNVQRVIDQFVAATRERGRSAP